MHSGLSVGARGALVDAGPPGPREKEANHRGSVTNLLRSLVGEMSPLGLPLVLQTGHSMGLHAINSQELYPQPECCWRSHVDHAGSTVVPASCSHLDGRQVGLGRSRFTVGWRAILAIHLYNCSFFVGNTSASCGACSHPPNVGEGRIKTPLRAQTCWCRSLI